VPGKARAKAKTELVGVRIPQGTYTELIGVIEAGNQWPDPPRQNFILEAIKEKIDRWKKDHPMWSPPAKDKR
jgi:hypothetical protein